jgi:hypothetical protein
MKKDKKVDETQKKVHNLEVLGKENIFSLPLLP